MGKMAKTAQWRKDSAETHARAAQGRAYIHNTQKHASTAATQRRNARRAQAHTRRICAQWDIPLDILQQRERVKKNTA